MPSLESHEKKIDNIERRINVFDERFTNVHTKLDEHKTSINAEIKKISDSLDTIKDGQHNQALLNQKMDWTLTTINDERERDRNAKYEEQQARQKDMKQIKYIVLGVAGTITASLAWTLIRMWLGI